MITLPDSPAPNGLRYELLDYGFIQRGAASLRVDRAGARYRVEISYPPMPPDTARVFLSRLQRAKREGLQIKIPLLGVSQSSPTSPGTPKLNGAGQIGAGIVLKTMTPGYQIKEGFWLTIREADGTPYLHTAADTVTVTGDGLAALEIEPPLRAPFPDEASVEFAEPFLEGFVDGDSLAWDVPVDRFIAPSFVIEECA